MAKFWKNEEVKGGTRTNSVPDANGCITTTKQYFAHRFWINWGRISRSSISCPS